MLRAARRRLPTGNLECTGGAGPPCLLWVLPAAAVTVCMAEVTGATALIPLSLGGSPGYGLSREFWKGPSMQTRSHSGYWLPLQIPGIGDETVRHLQFQNGANSALLWRGGLNTSWAPCVHAIPAQSYSAHLPVARGRKMADLYHIPGSDCWLPACAIWQILFPLWTSFPLCVNEECELETAQSPT